MSKIRPSDGDSWKATVPLCLALFVVDLLKRLVIKMMPPRAEAGAKTRAFACAFII